MDLFDLARTAVSLAAVFGALWYLHRRLTKGGPIKGRRGVLRPHARPIEVVARHGLGAKAGVAVVDVDGQRYLLGVTEHAINVLDRLGTAPAAVPAVGTPSPFDLQLDAAQQAEDAAPPAPPVPPTARPAIVDPRTIDAAPQQVQPQLSQPLPPPTTRPTVTTVTAAVVVQQTTATGEQSVAILPVQSAPTPYPSRRAAREAAQTAPVSGAESPQDEFERMLQAVIAEDAALPPAPSEPRMTRQPARAGSPLAGSVLHPETWRQTVAALRRLR